jgi:hypothetical protein
MPRLEQDRLTLHMTYLPQAFAESSEERAVAFGGSEANEAYARQSSSGLRSHAR